MAKLAIIVRVFMVTSECVKESSFSCYN